MCQQECNVECLAAFDAREVYSGIISTTTLGVRRSGTTLHKYKFECIIDESERLIPSDGSCMTNGRVGVIIIIIIIIVSSLTSIGRGIRDVLKEKNSITTKVVAVQFT